MQNTSSEFIFSTMHRELGAQFLVTRTEIAHVSFLPPQRAINSGERGAEDARHGSRFGYQDKIHPKTEGLFPCCSSSSYLPFPRAMTGLDEQQLNTNQAAGSAPCKTVRKSRLDFTFSGKNVNISPATRLAASAISIRARLGSRGLCKYVPDPFKCVTRASARLGGLQSLPDPPR